MNNRFQDYLDSIKSKNEGTAATYNAYRQYGDFDYNNADAKFLIDVIMSSKPKTIRSIAVARQALKGYLQFIQADDAVHILDELSINEIFTQRSNDIPKRLFSFDDFKDLLDFIDMTDDYNDFYVRTLVRACFEGIYSDDTSVLIHLRGSDVEENMVHLRNINGYEYNLEISYDLAQDLKEMSMLHEWRRAYKNGAYGALPTFGLYPDSCFKYNGDPDSYEGYKYMYWRVLRLLGKRYGRKITPQILFVSGVLYRVEQKAKEYNMTLEDVMGYTNVNQIGFSLLNQELARCNYTSDTALFKRTYYQAALQLAEDVE